MIDQTILENNLNDQVSYPEFFKALGYDDRDEVFLRWFYDPKRGEKAGKEKAITRFFDTILSRLNRYNDMNCGIFFVVNSGGQKAKDIKRCNAFFMEIDEGSFEEQLEKIKAFQIEPSIIIRTKKSLHVYWIIEGGLLDRQRWRAIQYKLINHFGSDEEIADPSRVMRLYGFNHCKEPENKVLVKLLKFDPELKYSVNQFEKLALPELTAGQKKKVSRTPKTYDDAQTTVNAKADRKTEPVSSVVPDGERIAIGHRHPHMKTVIGNLVNKMKEIDRDAILYAAYAIYQKECEILPDETFEDFENEYGKMIDDFLSNLTDEDDPEFRKYARKAWIEENPSEDFDQKLNEKGTQFWKEVFDSGHRAKEKGLLFDRDQRIEEGYQAHKADTENQVELPDVRCWADVYRNVPPRAPELIKGILRQGHKMLISGASKAGKSFLLIELAIAIAEGREWLGFKCEQGKVLYVNLEIDDSSFANRVNDIYLTLGWIPHHREDFFYWTLRGMADTLDELAPKIIEVMKEKNFAAVILDPIYKVIMGDENNASDMGRFCNQFDRICREAGCAAIYCHHHSKGGQGNKRAIDRASGSGVFGRDPDAILDMIELELTPEESFGHPSDATAWRLESSLREFKSIEPINFWFEHPLHKLDQTGELGKLEPRGSSRANLEKSGKKNGRKENAEKVRSALEYLIGADGTNHTTIKAVMEYLGDESPSDTAIRSYIRELLDDEFEYKNKLIFEKPLQAVDSDDLPFDTDAESKDETKNETKIENESTSEKKSKSKKRTK